MKSILEFKKEMVKVPVPSEGWENFFKKVTNYLKETWEIDVEAVEINSDISFMEENFEEKFLIEFIKSALNIPNNPIWKNIINITSQSKVSFVHNGSVTINTYFLNIEDKVDVVKRLSGIWVYENKELIDEFMDVNNETYRRLAEIRRELFPIDLINYE